MESNMTTQKQLDVYDVISFLDGINNTTVRFESDYSKIYIDNRLAFVPDFELVWVDREVGYYRVYTKIISSDHGKNVFAGYCIMNIDTPMGAMDLVDIIRRIYKNRANTKDMK
jgi:hypothetical protein